ncbi:hypothetical protein GGQ22_16390 [Nocardioides sp. zg-579]|uniref:Uncharacterized protein n=1 Tax=Nocardioides marmotae TaxID=2663857 RepID=A0A6I3JEM3_9ACTN|nr:hypothetical protein [Nocardioides marmotae]MCR6033005.1 hypothetical protein [Gordonia jinghuaiqii]MTB96656.1 hypothetical protein [Nocardioides marmotae]QKE03126.1 hypothetical protein HPC71_20220 [Nocardioides marmotae]
MPTAASWTSRSARSATDRWAEAHRAVADVGHLLRFRAATVRRRGTAAWLLLGFAALTTAAAVVPAYTPGAGGEGRAFDLLVLLPTALAGFLGLAIVSAVASGGGRELVARDAAAVLPLSPTTDHLGALALAPLNIAWLLQAWLLLGTTAYALGPSGLLAAQVVVLLWLAAATAVAQVVAWTFEGVRRGHHGIAGVRLLTLTLLGLALGLQLADALVSVLDQLPTRRVVLGMIAGFGGTWAATVAALLVLLLAAIALGAVPAHIAARRTPRDEARVESGRYVAGRLPGSDLLALVRTDRGSVWRAVPMRRGIAVLAIGPGAVALLGGLPWETMTVLPGLVASGGALLFGVNAWCLDARGGLWRESLPVAPGTVFAARAWVLTEFLLAASAVTVLLAAVRAGVPSVAELTALVCTVVVVTVQVVAAGMRWSAQRPYAVDLRSARATPAPPLTMVGYSTRLAVSTTLTGLVFSGLARVPAWEVSVLVAVPFLCWSLTRLVRAHARWVDPVDRARVVMTVAG